MSNRDGNGGGANGESYKLPRPKDEELMERAAKESKERREREKAAREKQQANKELLERVGRDLKERRGGGGATST